MTIDLILRFLAALLPEPARRRYLEEWRADLSSAREVGASRIGIVHGAAMLVLSIDRDNPVHTHEPRGAVSRRWALRGTSVLAAAVVLAIGYYFFLGGGGDFSEASPLTAAIADATVWVTVRMAILAPFLSAVFFLYAAWVVRTWLARLVCLAAATGPLLLSLALLLGGSLATAVAGAVVTLAAGVLGVIVRTASPRPRYDNRVAPRARRRGVALAVSVPLVALLVLGPVDLLLWNPEAKAPSLPLQTIYADLARVDGYSSSITLTLTVTWAVVGAALSATLVVLATLPSNDWFTARRIVMSALGLFSAGVVSLQFVGFGLGMSLADTYMLSGSGASLLSVTLPIAGVLASAGAVVVAGWAPQRRPLAPLEDAA